MSKLLTIKWMQLLVHIWRNRETNGKQQQDNLTHLTLNHFQLPPYEFHWATRQARDIAINANSLGTWFFSKEMLRGRMQRLLEIILYRTEYRGGGCLPVGATVHKVSRKHQPWVNEWMFLQSIKSVKHNAAKSTNRLILKKSRHLGFGVFIVHSSNY